MLYSTFCFTLFAFLTWSSYGCGVGLHKNKITCQTYYSQLTSLTSLLCTNIARNNITIYNACRNCFSAAITSNQNVHSLTQMSLCASTYLTNTNYASCASVLGNDTINLAGVQTVGCQSGFCGFVRCVRRINSNLLISTCYNQVASTNNASTDALRVQLYTNITSCILARARCSPVNPITGQSQNNRFVTTTTGCLGRTTRSARLVNTLQITTGGDLRVVAFPASSTVGNQLCSANTLTTQSGFTNVTCP